MMPALRSAGAPRLRFRRRAECTLVFKFGLHDDHTTPAARPLTDALSLENLGSERGPCGLGPGLVIWNRALHFQIHVRPPMARSGRSRPPTLRSAALPGVWVLA